MRPLDALREVERATVFKAGVPAATLERLPHAVRFGYLPEYIGAGGDPVATTLPLEDEPVATHAAGALPPFFAGLLPEGRRLSALRRAARTSADDEFTLLLAIGGDVVGDVQILPEGENPANEVDPLLQVERWEDVRFGSLLAASTGGEPEADRVGLAGVQDKVSARMIRMPVAVQGHRYFLKLDPPEFPHLVENEAFFLEAARKSGLSTAEFEVVRDSEGAAGLLVQRFDREPGPDGTVVLLPQEDACQVLGRYPADKYRATTEEVIAALAGACRAAPVAALELLSQFVFAYLSLNGDAHAKNFSIQQRAPDEWRVTPAYDLPSSWPYGDHTMALPIRGKRREDLGRDEFLWLASRVGLRPAAAERRLDQLVGSVDRWLGDLDRLPFDPGRLRKMMRAIEYRRRRLR